MMRYFQEHPSDLSTLSKNYGKNSLYQIEFFKYLIFLFFFILSELIKF